MVFRLSNNVLSAPCTYSFEQIHGLGNDCHSLMLLKLLLPRQGIPLPSLAAVCVWIISKQGSSLLCTIQNAGRSLLLPSLEG